MYEGPPRARRARPVADAPVDELLPRGSDLAKGWLLGLLEQVPLEAAPQILAGDLARQGPHLCVALLRSLASDAELTRLEPGGDLEPLLARVGELAGWGGAQDSLRAADALGAVLWSAVRGALREPDAELVAQLSERLARAMELVRAAALRRPPGASPDQEPDAPEAPAASVEPADGPMAAAPAAASSANAARPRSGAVQVLWQGALADEIERARQASLPLALLLIELEDARRVQDVEDAATAQSTFSRFLQAVRTAVRKQDILARESEGRIWVIARDTGRTGASALGERAVRAVQSAAPWRGAPLAASVGVALLGEEGDDADSLMAAAEEACLSAAASGIGVFRRSPPPT